MGARVCCSFDSVLRNEVFELDCMLYFNHCHNRQKRRENRNEKRQIMDEIMEGNNNKNGMKSFFLAQCYSQMNIIIIPLSLTLCFCHSWSRKSRKQKKAFCSTSQFYYRSTKVRCWGLQLIGPLLGNLFTHVKMSLISASLVFILSFLFD